MWCSHYHFDSITLRQNNWLRPVEETTRRIKKTYTELKSVRDRVRGRLCVFNSYNLSAWRSSRWSCAYWTITTYENENEILLSYNVARLKFRSRHIQIIHILYYIKMCWLSIKNRKKWAKILIPTTTKETTLHHKWRRLAILHVIMSLKWKMKIKYFLIYVYSSSTFHIWHLFKSYMNLFMLGSFKTISNCNCNYNFKYSNRLCSDHIRFG